MPLTGTESTWATAIVSALQGANIPQDRELTGSELSDLWALITTAHTGHLTANAGVVSSGATGSGPPGGPLPIPSLPGSLT